MWNPGSFIEVLTREFLQIKLELDTLDQENSTPLTTFEYQTETLERLSRAAIVIKNEVGLSYEAGDLLPLFRSFPNASKGEPAR